MKSEICENCGVIHKGKWFNCKKFKPKNHTLSDDIIPIHNKDMGDIVISQHELIKAEKVKKFIKQLKEFLYQLRNGNIGNREMLKVLVIVHDEIDKLSGEKLR